METSAVGKFYMNFKVEEDQYNVHKIALAGILLGQGSATEKMTVLFDHYDTEETHLCTRELFIQMLDEVVDMTINLLPLLASGDRAYEVSDQRLKTYINMLRKSSPLGKQNITKDVFGDTEDLTKKYFIKRVKSSDLLAKCISPTEIRIYLHNLFHRTPKRQLDELAESA